MNNNFGKSITRVGRLGTWGRPLASGVFMTCALTGSLSVMPAYGEQPTPAPQNSNSDLHATTIPVINVQGSTTFNAKLLAPNLERIEKLSGVRVNSIPNKSIWGVIALLERRADVAMISARMDGEIAVAKKTASDLPYDELREYKISSTRIAFAVHPSNPVRTLTFDQVRRIFLGQLRNWSQVGGKDRVIRVVAVQDGGGTVVAVRKQMLGGKPLTTEGAIRIESAKHIIKVVEQTPGAIAIAQLGLVKKAGLPEIKTEKNVEQSLNLVTLGKPSPHVLSFIKAARTVAADKRS